MDSTTIHRASDYFDTCPVDRLSKDDLNHDVTDLLEANSRSTIKFEHNTLQHYRLGVLKREWDWVLIVMHCVSVADRIVNKLPQYFASNTPASRSLYNQILKLIKSVPIVVITVEYNGVNSQRIFDIL